MSKGNVSGNDHLKVFQSHVNNNQFRGNIIKRNENNRHQGQQSTLGGVFKNECKFHGGNEWKYCFQNPVKKETVIAQHILVIVKIIVQHKET